MDNNTALIPRGKMIFKFDWCTCISNNVIQYGKFLKKKNEFIHGLLRGRFNFKSSKIKFGIFVTLNKQLKRTNLEEIEWMKWNKWMKWKAEIHEKFGQSWMKRDKKQNIYFNVKGELRRKNMLPLNLSFWWWKCVIERILALPLTIF